MLDQAVKVLPALRFHAAEARAIASIFRASDLIGWLIEVKQMRCCESRRSLALSSSKPSHSGLGVNQSWSKEGYAASPKVAQWALH